MKKKIEILCTLGPNSLTKKFLNFSNSRLSQVRLNLSHIEIQNLEKIIKFVKKETNVPICIDTEGAQIRTKFNSVKKFKKGNKIYLHKNKKFHLYPPNVFQQIKTNDVLFIGFEGLAIRVSKKKDDVVECIALSDGILKTNQGVFSNNKKIKLNYLTAKDFLAIDIAKRLKINNFALSFTNKPEDINKFNKLLPGKRKIFKIESKMALNNWKKLLNLGSEFLIDRGDLSKETSIEDIPFYQRKIITDIKKNKKKVFVATNFLESMIEKPFPTRAEANDIYSSLEMGADGLVLAAETAVGNYPIQSVEFLIKVIKKFNKKNL